MPGCCANSQIQTSAQKRKTHSANYVDGVSLTRHEMCFSVIKISCFFQIFDMAQTLVNSSLESKFLWDE